MNRPFLLPPLSGEVLLQLQRLIRAPNTSAGLYRRCLLIWQLAAGYSITEAGKIANETLEDGEIVDIIPVGSDKISEYMTAHTEPFYKK